MPSNNTTSRRQAPPRRSLTDRELNRVLFALFHGFVKGQKSVLQLAAIVESQTEIKLSRQGIHEALRAGRRKDFMQLTPPRADLLEGLLERLAGRHGIEVVSFRGTSATEYVAQAAAHEVRRLIFEIADARPGPVHLGLGIGMTTKLFVAELALLLRSRFEVPPLVIHALTHECYFKPGLETPATYAASLQRDLEEVTGVTFVALGPDQPGNSEAFDRRSEIDVLVTSLASSQDRESYLWEVVTRSEGEQGMLDLIAKGCLGDLQLHPYSRSGPMSGAELTKRLTLFDIPDMLEMRRQKGRYVVLMAGPQRDMETGKAAALRPLLLQPELQVWDRLVVDWDTAYELAGSPKDADMPLRMDC